MSVHPEVPPSRRTLLRRMLAVGLGVPLFGGLLAMLRKIQHRQVPGTVTLPNDLPSGLTALGAVVVQRDDDGAIHAFSGRCTHLGCHLDRVQGDEAVCPCHGSRFRADGAVVKGPATRPLEALVAEPDKTSGGWIVRVRT